MAGISLVMKIVDEASSRLDAMSSAGEKVLDSIEKMESVANDALSAMTDGADQTAQAIGQAAQATDRWSDKLDNFDKATAEAVSMTDQLAEQGNMVEDALQNATGAIEITEEEIDKLGKEAEEAGKEIEGLGKETETTGKKSEEFGDKSIGAVEGLHKVLVAAGIAALISTIGTAFMDSSHAAAQFETGLAQVSTIADTAVLSMGDISDQIGDLSRDASVFVTDLSEATYGAISASVDTANAVSFVATSNELAVGGFTRQATAVDVLTTAINAYGLETAAATQISDYLVTTQNLGKCFAPLPRKRVSEKRVKIGKLKVA